MKRSQKILLPLHGLQEGKHDFEFEIDNRFFEEYKHPDLLGGEFKIDAELTKGSRVSSLSYTFKGNAFVNCDICLDSLELPIQGIEELYIKTDQDLMDEDSDEIIYTAESDNEVDLSQHVYESICIRLPFKKVHPEDENGEPTCNKEMLDKVISHTGVEETSEEKTTDPRWDDLKKLLDENN
jgi:uncharacterized protein